jgi:LemA protein
LLAAVGALGAWIYPLFDQFAQLEESVRREWANLDTQLQRRYALIPNLVATAERTAEHEETIFLGIADSYSGYQRASSVDERIRASYRVERGLRMLWGRAFPNLRADRNFGRLMQSLERTENQIAEQRMRYNAVVAEHNTLAHTVRGRLASVVFTIEDAPYYQPPSYARERPDVDFAEPLSSRAAEVAERESAAREAETPPPAASAASAAPDAATATAPPPPAPAPPAADTDPKQGLVFRGSMRNRGQFTALVVLPNGRNLSLRRGDRIPELQARVVEVTAQAVTLERPGPDGTMIRYRVP